ncbi:MAG TPA: hypothetical protein VLC55_11975, partial [Burkholderiales bacterium]|nr:hypothetical protein [Burkholderiales bacterium]
MAAVLLATALGALALWGRSESALRWLAGQTSAWSGGRVVLEGVTGSVLGPLRVVRLGYRSPEVDVTVEAFEADWSPVRLVLGRALRVTRLQAARVQVEVKPTDTPLELPQDLTPPLPLVLARVDVPRIELRGLGPELLIQDLKGALEADAGSYRLDVSSLRLPQVSLSGNASLAAARPFTLGGAWNATASYADQTFSIPTRLSGNLEAVELAASVEHAWAKGAVSASIAPFDAQPVRALHAEFSGMDPARHGKGFPSADISTTLTAVAAQRGLAGRLEVVNRTPGRLDQGRLPLERASSRVALADDELRFEELVITLAGAGILEGTGRADSAQAELSLRTAGLALNALHASLKPLRPAGTMMLRATPEQQAAVANLASGEYRLQLDVLHRGEVLSVRSAALRARGSELEATGELRLDPARTFAARGALTAFNPAQWGEFPKARLNARLEAEGQLEPGPQGTLRYRVVDSQYGGAPLSGEGVLGYAGKQALRADGHLALGDNRVSFRGGVGPGERLAWTLDAASLAVLGPEFSGKLTGSGWFAGDLEHPSYQLDLQGSRLRLPGGLAAGTLRASGEFTPGAEGILRGRLEAQKAQLGGYALDSLEATADGTPPRHNLSVAAKNADIDFQAGAEGGISAGPRWSGSLLSLVTHKPVAGSLASPTSIAIARDELEIGAADIRVGDARLALERLAWRDGRLASRGRFTALPLALLARPGPGAP